MSADYPDVETASEDYARRFAGPVGGYFLEAQARLTLDLLRPFPRASVLDVGGGHAQLAFPLAAEGFAVTVLGSSDSCATRLRPLLEQGRATFRRGDLLAAPFADRAFDVVLAFRLLPHLDAWPRLLGELCRLARRAVVVDYPTRRSVNAVAGPLFEVKRGVEGDTRPFLVFREAEIRDGFAGHGFAVTGREPQFFFPMALHRAARSARLARALEGLASLAGLRRALGSPVILRAERT